MSHLYRLTVPLAFLTSFTTTLLSIQPDSKRSDAEWLGMAPLRPTPSPSERGEEGRKEELNISLELTGLIVSTDNST